MWWANKGKLNNAASGRKERKEKKQRMMAGGTFQVRQLNGF